MLLQPQRIYVDTFWLTLFIISADCERAKEKQRVNILNNGWIYTCM